MASRKAKVFSLSLAQGILTVIGVVSSMVFTRVLTKEDYATYLQTFLAYDFVLPILTLGLPSALFYFLPNEERGKKVVEETLLLLFMAGIIFSLFLLCGGTHLLAMRFSNPNLTTTLHWMIFFPLYTFPVLCLGSVLVVNDKVGVNSRYNIYTGLGLTATIIITTFIGRCYCYPVLSRIFFPLLIFPIGIYLCFKYTKGSFERPEFSNMWKILKFSVPLGIATTLASLSLQLSSIIVSSFCPPNDYAVYAVGAHEIPFIAVITGSIAVVIMADMSKYIKEGKTNDALTLFRKGTTTSSMFLMPIMVFLFIFADSFIHLLFSESYTESVLPFRIFLFYLPIRIAQYNSVYIAFGQSKAVLFRTALHFFFTIISCLFFVWLFGYWGAALGAIIASYFWAVPYNIVKLSDSFGCKKREVLPFKKVVFVFLLSLVSGIVSLPCLYLPIVPLFKFISGAVVYIAVYYVLMYRYCPEFKEISYSFISKIKKK